jgi:isopentenyl-diphosphate delta-isomerase
MEYLDVLTEFGDKTGTAKLRTEVHQDGDWHLAIHVWIINSRGELLLQRRSPQKDTSPNKWSASYGGHVQAGNSSLTEALREGAEELGLHDLVETDLTHLFTVTQEHIDNGRINREFNDVYLVCKDIDIASLVLQEEEVADVRFMPWQEVERHINENNPEFCHHPEEHPLLFAHFAKRA